MPELQQPDLATEQSAIGADRQEQPQRWPGSLMVPAGVSGPLLQRKLARRWAERGDVLQRQQAPAAPAATTATPAGAKVAKDGTFPLNGITVTIQPDLTVDELESAAKTNYDPKYGTAGFSFEGDKVTAFTPVPPVTVSIQTLYRKDAKPGDASAYGRGTTAEDKKAGNTTLRFHESQHGKDFLDYLGANPPPVFAGKVGMKTADFKAAQQRYLDAMKAYFKKMEAQSEIKTDCVGTPADFCAPGTPESKAEGKAP